MDSSLLKLLVVPIGIGLARLTHTEEVKAVGDASVGFIEIGIFNYTLSDNETQVVYNQEFGPHRLFAYATVSPPSRTAVVRILPAESSLPFAGETCEFDFPVPEGSRVVISSLHLSRISSKDTTVFVAYFTWFVEGDKREHGVDGVDTITCRRRPGKAPVPAASTSTGTGSVTGFDMKELEAPKGHHFIDKQNKDESAVHINYADHAAKTVSLAAKFKQSARGRVKTESLALDKYGVCFMEGTSVTCAQSDLRKRNKIDPNEESREVADWVSVTLKEPADWFAVHNHAEADLLLTAGKCPDNHCDEFDLYRVRTNGTVGKPVHFKGMALHCAKPTDLTNNVFYDKEKATICFNMVCLDRPKLTYGRYCVDDESINSFLP